MSESLDQENKLVIAETTEYQEEKVSNVYLHSEATFDLILKVVFPLFYTTIWRPTVKNVFGRFFEKRSLL